MAATFTVLVLGLPEAGKTTFLAALWHAISTPGSDATLTLAKLHPLRDYLNAIAGAWLRCEPVPRTTQATEQVVTIHVRGQGEAATEASIAFPDHAGERFVEQWAHREWSREYAELVGRANAVLLFINPETHVAEPTIPQTMRLAADLGETSEAALDGDGIPWEPRMAPADVQLVDLLQAVLWYRQVTTMPVAVVVSAWDLAERALHSPREWLCRKSPLLSQFLDATIGASNYEIFGVSGQGGDLVRDSEKLLDNPKPAERVIVVIESSRSHNITRPIEWLLGKPDGGR